MNVKEKEEFAVMKNEITHIKSDVAEIKHLLEEHIHWESGKYDSLKKDFASKWVEKVSIGVLISVIAAIVVFVVTK
jgi:hypothetical protein